MSFERILTDDSVSAQSTPYSDAIVLAFDMGKLLEYSRYDVVLRIGRNAV
jgi:hypothetical protein